VTVESLENIMNNKEDLQRFRNELRLLKDKAIRNHVKMKMRNKMTKKSHNSIAGAIK